MKKRNNKSYQVVYSDFLTFSADSFERWWLENMSRWLEDPYQENLFSPVTEIVIYRDESIFEGISRIDRSFPAQTRLNFKEGLNRAIDSALAKQDMRLSGVLLQAATSIHCNEVQDIIHYHLRAINTAKWFDSFKIFRINGVFFDLVLDNIDEAPSKFYSTELIKYLDMLLDERGVEELNYQRSQNLFLVRVRQERDNIGFLTERFLSRINLLLKNNRIDWNNLLINISILMNRFDQEQLNAILTAALQWQEKLEAPQTSYPYKLPNTSDDTTNVDYYGAPWLFWAISNVLRINEGEMKPLIAEVKSPGTHSEEANLPLSKRESANMMETRHFYPALVDFTLKSNA